MAQISPVQPQNDGLLNIAIVGRVNVGKSTLFNRITDTGKAMVSPKAGTTRTSNKAVAFWRGVPFRVVDTGGMFSGDADPFSHNIKTQIDNALAESDLVLFVVDITKPLNNDERAIAKRLHAAKKKVILVVNKVDNARLERQKHEMRFESLGCGEPIMIAAGTGRGVGDLLDHVFSFVDTSREFVSELPKGTIKVAIIGKPNVGKSSLFNALIGREAVIVSDIPHTTRETFDTLVKWNDQHILFIDTAGIRRLAHVEKGLEEKGVDQSIKQIKEADVVLFVLDASHPISHQDKALSGMIEDAKKPLIIVANKWDTVLEHHADMPFLQISEFSGKWRDAADHYMDYINTAFRFISFAPIVYVSALTKKNVLKLLPMIQHVNAERNKMIDPVTLDRTLTAIKKHHLPTKGKGVHHPDIHSMKQIATNPPVFQLHIRQKTDLHDSYVRYLAHQLRNRFGFTGVPLVFYIKK